MQKRHLFTVINLAALVFALTLWVISIAEPEAMGDFDFAWAAFIATSAWAVSFTARVFVEKQVILKKSWTILAFVFFMAAAGCLIGALALPGKLILPIILLAAAVAALVGSLVLAGKKWDMGDNEKPGYKNYYERKAEEEAAKAEQTAKDAELAPPSDDQN